MAGRDQHLDRIESLLRQALAEVAEARFTHRAVFEGRSNQEVAEARSVAEWADGCRCGHGLTWHDTPDLHCMYPGSWSPSGVKGPCDCPTFAGRQTA